MLAALYTTTKLFRKRHSRLFLYMVMSVMDRVRSAGIKDVGLVTTSVPDDGAEEKGK